MTFSSMDSLRRSYFLNTARKAGIAFLPMSISPNARKGTTITNIVAREPPIIYDMMIENTSISGHLTAVRMIIMNDICTLLTSVVMRVTSDEDENLSIFSKE